jgi:hypothetical protein
MFGRVPFLEVSRQSGHEPDRAGWVLPKSFALIAILTEPRYQDATRELMQLEYAGLARAN